MQVGRFMLNFAVTELSEPHRNMKKRIIISIIAWCVSALTATVTAQTGRLTTARKSAALPMNVAPVKLGSWGDVTPDSAGPAPSMLYMPLIFDSDNESNTTGATQTGSGGLTLRASDDWLTEAIGENEKNREIRRSAMVEDPENVPFNKELLPEPPKQYAIAADPATGKLQIQEAVVPAPVVVPITEAPVKIHHWIHSFDGSLHFTQAYISSNWYQGGYNNLSVLADIKWDVSLNPNLHPNMTFTNTLHYRLGMMTARNDAYRKITFSEDNFQFNSTIGFKAVKKWYYSASLQFKTQFFTNYKENTMDMKAAFLSPAELNLGLGMTFTHENKEKDQKFTLAINPLSYNMKYCRNISDISPTEFGIKEGHHAKHDFGSSINGNLKWKFNAYITWSAQLDFFTNYKYVQANWQNTFDFYVTRHLSTQIYTHLRFDRNHPRDDKWRYFQFRESLSFGLTYRFATI